ncbi:MAG: homoserine dehydrogenase [Rhodospirillales bacterium RIFCSPLOWO2_12_FULL_58_28]|nr:MAG: homoserine dehydrogenase [Rhodospirillales bacterium RIFCSPLOWO2_02_FULL_58_16]OHC76898.1 MAG: homoserine dehydrogenase [Rhodospirillales bacterium RIFCSPLOWO2_12_FULL_58_28]
MSAPKTSPLRVAIAGLGTIGGGVFKLLAEQSALLERRCGRAILVVAVADKDSSKKQQFAGDGVVWHDDALLMAAADGIDVVIELIGGSHGIAKTLCETAIAHGKHVVTANKALIAHHGTALALAAEKAGVTLAYEAAVAGGIPIIKALREGLAANNFRRVYGILNGTCNYILTAMRESGREFDVVLKEAQELGYAEADPSFDIDGIDTAHKIAILAGVAFGTQVNFNAVYTEGIRRISPLDIGYAAELGYRIKLLGIAGVTENGIEQRVHPCMVPLAAPIAHIEGVFNAVVVEGDFIDTTMFEGRGAGAGPTSSAVAADLIDIARGCSTPTFSLPAKELKPLNAAPIELHRGAYYVRLMVLDRPGVFADIAAVLRDNNISMEAVLQRSRAPGEAVPVVMTLHEAGESAIMRMMEEINGNEAIVEPALMIRIVSF